MVWPFQKKKVLDLTSSKIKVPESAKTRLENEYKNLTSSGSQESALGFLGNLAGAAEPSVSNEDSSFKHLKVKIEDIEYKLDSLSKRLGSIIDRIDLTEKKIDRIERRGLS